MQGPHRVQEIAPSVLLVVSIVGVGWTDHCSPFHCSTKVPSEYPTAVQFLREAHEIPRSWLPSPPGLNGLSVVCVVQLEPFQRSAKVVDWSLPTKVQESRDVHDTSVTTPFGSEVVSSDQLEPFHCPA